MFQSLLALGLTASTAAAAQVPDYVNKYAPMVYLFSGENYFPSDIAAQLSNTTPKLNSTTTVQPSNPTLNNLNDLNSVPNSNAGKDIYLTSNTDFTVGPNQASYLKGTKPDTAGKTQSAVSATIITVAHPDRDLLDAFYFYFYAFDYGGDYIFVGNVGDHVGDWEHNMIRFNSTTQKPISIWYSQHSGGEAFTYDAVEKYDGVRVVNYCANGTHANYAKAGTHDHTIPGVNLPEGPIEDHTDNGSIWDPTANAYYFSFTPSNASSTEDDTGSFTAYEDGTPVEWLYFAGHWGDDRLSKDDPRQNCDLGIDGLCQYQGGPTGPYFKDLNREDVCPDSQDDCNVLGVLLP